MKIQHTVLLLGIIAFGIFSSACGAVSASTTRSTVIITSPPSNSQFHEGDQVAIQSTSTDLAGISRVELAVDGTVLRTDPSPTAQVSFTVIQLWTATPGLHTIQVRAINAANQTLQPAAIVVLVLTNVTTATPPPTITSVPAVRPCLNSAFVADVTVADGTTFSPGQSFNKIWRVRNTGTCSWGANDQLIFVGGEAMTANTAIAVPTTAPGSTADLLVAMSAPAAPGVHTGLWRLRGTNGAFFGAPVAVTIKVASPTAANCPFTPVIESFTASPLTLAPGQSAMLNWGFVKGAQFAEIDNGIGGVATPGSTTVSPSTTTTYTLTATCGSKVSRAQVTITVIAPTPTP